MTSPNFMVIGLQIRKLHRGWNPPAPAVLDSKKPGLFRVNPEDVFPACKNGFCLQQNTKFLPVGIFFKPCGILWSLVLRMEGCFGLPLSNAILFTFKSVITVEPHR